MLYITNEFLYNQSKGGIVMDIGISIQNHRKRLGLSQEELGQQLCVSRQTVSQWETGQTVPSVDNLLRLKEIFGISLDALCDPDAETEAALAETPLQECRFTLTRSDIKETCQLACRQVLRRYLILSCISITIMLFVILVADSSVPGFWIPFTLCCILGFTIRFLMDRKNLRKPLRSQDCHEHKYKFYDDYFLVFLYRNGVQFSWKRFEYKDIKKFYYTKNLVVLRAGNVLYPLPKESFYNCLPLQRYQDLNPKKKAPGPHAVGWKIVSLILFIASIASLLGGMAAVAFAAQFSDHPYPDLWVFFLFLPIPIASIVFGIVAKCKGYPQKKNIIVGIVMAVVLTLYGCLTFAFSAIYTDDPVGVNRIEYYMDIDIPEYRKITTQNLGKGTDPSVEYYRWYTSEVYFDKESSQDLLETVQADDRFMRSVPSELIGLTDSGFYSGDNQYVLFYNVYTKQYNEYPSESGIYRIIMVSFDADNNCMYIEEYNINYVAN